MANLPSNMATTGVSGAVTGLVLKYLELHGYPLDETTTVEVITVSMAACHFAVEVAQYIFSWFPKPPAAGIPGTA